MSHTPWAARRHDPASNPALSDIFEPRRRNRPAPGPSGRPFLWSPSTRIERCPATTQAPQMTESPHARADAATAGGLLLGAMIACAAAILCGVLFTVYLVVQLVAGLLQGEGGG